MRKRNEYIDWDHIPWSSIYSKKTLTPLKLITDSEKFSRKSRISDQPNRKSNFSCCSSYKAVKSSHHKSLSQSFNDIGNALKVDFIYLRNNELAEFELVREDENDPENTDLLCISEDEDEECLEKRLMHHRTCEACHPVDENLLKFIEEQEKLKRLMLLETAVRLLSVNPFLMMNGLYRTECESSSIEKLRDQVHKEIYTPEEAEALQLVGSRKFMVLHTGIFSDAETDYHKLSPFENAFKPSKILR